MLTPFTSTDSAYCFFREGERCYQQSSPLNKKRNALKEVLQEDYNMGQGYHLAASALHHLEGYRVQTLDPGILMETQHGLESGVVQLFVEAQESG